MREILFRGKRTDTSEEYVYGCYVYNDLTNTHYIQYKKENSYLRRVSILPETLGQYIGFKDSKGEKLFEGMEVSIDDNKGVIEWCPVEGRWQVRTQIGNMVQIYYLTLTRAEKLSAIN